MQTWHRWKISNESQFFSVCSVSSVRNTGFALKKQGSHGGHGVHGGIFIQDPLYAPRVNNDAWLTTADTQFTEIMTEFPFFSVFSVSSVRNMGICTECTEAL
jgi:hypothetical protein